MPTTRDIRRRIKSVKNTAQITKAMQLVAASKMKRAQDQALSGRHYAALMNKVLVNLKEVAESDSHPLLQEGSGDRELILVVSSDKGLCGALNTNLLRMVTEEQEGAGHVTVGSKGRQTLVRMKRDLLADFPVEDPVAFPEVKVISKFITEKFLEGEFSRVRVAFTNFINTLSQEPHLETLLPISPVDLGQAKDFEGVGKDEEGEPEVGGVPEGGYEFEPHPRTVLDRLLPQYVDYQIYQMILEARASEHSARMVAMKSATDNAEQMIKDLTLQYNKMRQAAITAELLEITTAQMALE